MKIIGVIPSRLQSSRLSQKPLVDIEGLPMVVHVLKRAQLSRTLDEVYVATDSEEIYELIEAHNGKAMMTSSQHRTGSDRIAEAAGKIEADIIVNIQGDEPLLEPGHIDRVVEPFKKDPDLQIAVVVTPYTKKNSPSVIKAVLDLNDHILYCSRDDLPSAARCPVETMWKMSFIVPFRKDFLLKYAAWEQTPLEKIEFNEYLRVLEHGYKIKAVRVAHAEISVDTPEDLAIVREKMKADPIRQKYMQLIK